MSKIICWENKKILICRMESFYWQVVEKIKLLRIVRLHCSLIRRSRSTC